MASGAPTQKWYISHEATVLLNQILINKNKAFTPDRAVIRTEGRAFHYQGDLGKVIKPSQASIPLYKQTLNKEKNQIEKEGRKEPHSTAKRKTQPKWIHPEYILPLVANFRKVL